MANIDDRVVSMSFENTKFEQGITTSLSSLDKLKSALGNIGKNNGIDEIEKSANKVTLSHPASMIDKLKAKLGFGKEASEGFGAIENASNKTTLTGASTAIDKIGSKFGHLGVEATDAFATVERSSGHVELAGLSTALDGVTAKFGAMQVAGIAALSTIVSRATTAGTNLVKSLSVAPIMTGFKEYELKLGSIQTILANTQASGATLKDVNKTLNELNHYADKTIYNFGQMTKNIGTFTAAGVDLDTSAASIKGIANLAALSGSNSEQASRAMYQLSQAISAGRVSLMDWKSVENAGMGGTVFQRQLAETAVAMGVLDDKSVKLVGKMKNVKVEGESFRTSIMAAPGKESWLTTKVLTNALASFTGDLKDADLAAMGFNKSQILAIQKQAKTAQEAATKVKTLTQLIDTAKESAGSGWATTWEIIFGNFNQAKKMWSDASNVLGGFINQSANARNHILKDWKELGGRKDLIASVRNVFEALGAVLKPIKEAFREIFPPKTGVDLWELTRRLRDFTDLLKIGPETAENLRRTFKGVFALFDIGKKIVGGIFSVVKDLFAEVSNSSGGILNFTGDIGDLLVKLDDWLDKGNRLTQFFDSIGDGIVVVSAVLDSLKDAVVGVFNGSGIHAFGEALDGLNDKLNPAGATVGRFSDAWKGLIKIFHAVTDALAPVASDIADKVGTLVDGIADAFAKADYDAVFKIIQTSLIGGIFLTMKKAFSGGGILGKLNFGDMTKSLSGSLDIMNRSLTSLQTNLKAHTLVTIATAIALLAGSVLVLSHIDAAGLTRSMTAIATGLGELLGAMLVLDLLGGKSGFLKMSGVATGFVVLGVALNILALAVKQFSGLSWEELAHGLAGVAGVLVAVAGGMKVMQKLGIENIFRISVSIAALGIALNILGVAVKIFASMSWEKMGQGLAGMAAALLIIAEAMWRMPPNILAIGPALIALGVALNLIGASVLAFGSMDLLTLVKGIGGMAIALALIGEALWLMPPGPLMLASAAAMAIMAPALVVVAGAIALMGNLGLGTLVKGILGLAATLIVLAGGLTLMIAALPGAAALVVAAGALAILVPVIGTLGTMEWGTIFKGLAAIALTLLVVATAGLVAAPALVILAGALGVMGGALLAIGLGVNLLAKGLVLLGRDGGKGVAVVIAALTGMVAVLPKIIIDFVKGLVEIVAAIAGLAPKIVDSMVKILGSLLDVIIKSAPKFAIAAGALIQAVLKILNENAGPLIEAGFKLLRNLLQGIADNIGTVTNQIITIVTTILNTLSSRAGQFTRAGADVLVKFLSGIANNLQRVVQKGGDIVVAFIRGVANNVYRVVTAAGTVLTKFLSAIANATGNIVSAGADVIIKFVRGLGQRGADIVDAAVTAIGKFINAVAKGALKLVAEGGKAVLNFLNGMTDWVNKNGSKIAEAVGKLTGAIAASLVSAVPEMVSAFVAEFKKQLSDKLPHIKLPHIGNPFKSITDGVSGSSWDRIGDEMAAGLNVSLKQGGDRVMGEVSRQFASMSDVGRLIGRGFQKGLLGSRDDIVGAFRSLSDKMKSEMSTLRSDISREQEKLNNLLDATKLDHEAIAKARAAIRADEHDLKLLSSAHTVLITGLKSQKTELIGISRQYDAVTEKLKVAEQKLADLIKARDDAITGFSDQYSKLPTIDAATPDKLGAYIKSLEDQGNAVETYSNTLDQLRALGLDDATYQKLLADGTADQEFANQLLAGGKVAIDGINALDAKLAAKSKTLAEHAGHGLHDAGIKIATDLIDGVDEGLKAQQSRLRKQMEAIAEEMINAIKKKLKIKSPSEVFRDHVGKNIVLGVAKGIDENANEVGASLDSMVTTMTSTLSTVPDIVSGIVDMDPTITPILDLSQVRKEADNLGSLTDVVPITAEASFQQAAAISLAQSHLANSGNDILDATTQPPIKFEQNNYSPESLPEAEIYRRTNNLLSQAKDALGIS